MLVAVSSMTVLSMSLVLFQVMIMLVPIMVMMLVMLVMLVMFVMVFALFLTFKTIGRDAVLTLSSQLDLLVPRPSRT